VDTSTSRGWKETVWSGTGSGCSAVIPKPDRQTDTGCSGYRTVADVAVDADPYSQVDFGGTNPYLNDVTTGSDGSCTGHGHFADPSLAHLCTAATGYDGPTGMGTPSGTEAF
jgi:hypothetical protein